MGQGRYAIIEYEWPPIAFEIEQLFKSDIDSGTMVACDPKIVVLKEELKLVRKHKNEVPQGAIGLELPVPVQTARNKISRSGVSRKDGSHHRSS